MDLTIAWISDIVIIFALNGSSEALTCNSPGVLYEPSPGYKICYRFNDTDVLGETADASCHHLGGHAVQIFNADTWNFLKSIPQDFFQKSEYWVGIKPPHWIWLDRNDSLVLSDEVWATDRPIMANIHRERCVASDADGWVDDDCGVAKGFLCEKVALVTPVDGKMTPSCADASYTLFETGCYKYFPSQTVFYNAKIKCQAENAFLAKLDTKDKVEKMPLMKTLRMQWTWQNGSAVVYLPWKSGEPDKWDKPCVIAKIGDEQAWIPEDCDSKTGLLCEQVVSLPCSPGDLKYTRRRGQKISQEGLSSYSVAARSIMDCVTTCTSEHGCQCTAVEYSASSGECTVLQGAVVDVNTKFVAASGVDTMIILNGLH